MSNSLRIGKFYDFIFIAKIVWKIVHSSKLLWLQNYNNANGAKVLAKLRKVLHRTQIKEMLHEFKDFVEKKLNMRSRVIFRIMSLTATFERKVEEKSPY